MIPGSPEPERAFVLAVLAQGVDAENELAEVRELARTAGVDPVGRGRAAPRPAGAAHLCRQGEARGAEAAVPGGRRREPARRRRARPGAAALPRERARRARDRPDAADPRHLRPACDERRGEAAGRARAARVQPPAHARHVAAPRAARRRRRHARPRRVAARVRPPPRAAAHFRPAGAAQGPRAAARDAPQGALAHRGADDRSRRIHERRQVDAPQRAHRR